MSKVRATVLSKEPLIIYAGSYVSYGASNEFIELAEKLIDKDVVFLMLLAWTAEGYPQGLKEWRDAFIGRFSRHKLIYLTNTHYEKKLLNELGVPAEFFNHNMFVDPANYCPLNISDDKEFDAVYNGQFLEFKRHELAVGIRKLAVIGYNFSTEYGREIRSCMVQATYCNSSADNQAGYKWLGPPEVNEIYNKSSVGLCLSAAEGAMHASIEYLLSGLPIVTTINKGGRDYFFQGDFTIWAADDSVEIAKAVERVKSMDVDPFYIRSKTIEKIDHLQGIFFNFLASFCGGDIKSIETLRHVWMQNYNDKLIVPKEINYFLEGL